MFMRGALHGFTNQRRNGDDVKFVRVEYRLCRLYRVGNQQFLKLGGIDALNRLTRQTPWLT